MSSTTSETAVPKLAADPTVAELQPVLADLRSYARSVVIKTDAEFQAAGDRLKRVKLSLTQIEAARLKITGPLNEALRAVNAEARESAAPWLDQEKAIKRAMVVYSDEQDRIRAEEQRKANERAEAECKRLAAQAAETERKAREEAEAKRRAAADAEAAGRTAEAAKLNNAAARIEERAETKVENLQDRASQVVAPVSDVAAPKVAGVTVPKVWTFEITDPAAIPREYLEINETKIRKVVAALQGNTNIPGVRVFQQKRIAAGAA